MLQEQLSSKAAEAEMLNTNLQQSMADSQNLTHVLSSTQAELVSATEQSKQQEAELQTQIVAAAAREADSAAELESARAQAGQLGRQLSEQIQRLDVLQVGNPSYVSCLPQHMQPCNLHRFNTVTASIVQSNPQPCFEAFFMQALMCRQSALCQAFCAR